MRKLEDLSTEELQEECERREIQLEISDGDEIARDHLKQWLKENEHDEETYDFDAEEEYDEAAEGGEEEEEDLLDEVAAEAVANANEEKEVAEEKTEDKTEDKSEAADTNEDVAEAEETTEKPAEENEASDDREIEQEEKAEEPKEGFEMVEQAEVDAANEAEADVQDQAPSEQTNGTEGAEGGEEKLEEEKMDTTEGEGATDVAADEEFSDDSDMFKEAQKAKLNEENNPAPEAVPEADILELDYDDDTLIDKPAESATEKPKSTPEGKSEVDKMANVKFLWISGLNKDVKATEIREEFEKNELGERPLRSCKVAVSKKNGGSAFAFCEMGNAELADKIIALYHAKDMCGKIVQIKKEKFIAYESKDFDPYHKKHI